MKYLIATFTVMGLMFGTATIQAEEVIEETPTEEVTEETPTEEVEENGFWQDFDNVVSVLRGVGWSALAIFVLRLFPIISYLKKTDADKLIEKYGATVAKYLTKRPELIMAVFNAFRSTEEGQRQLEELNHAKNARLYVVEEQMLRLEENIKSKIYDNPDSLKKAQELLMKLSEEYEQIK